MPDECAQKADEPHPRSPATELVVITGMSGAGRSEAMHTFEDLGYFCIDNLPPAFISQLVRLSALPESRLRRLAVVCDVRGHEFFEQLADEIDRLKAKGVALTVLFLEAGEDVLLNRFKETRRRHPMCEESDSLLEGIRLERAALAGVRGRADLIIDTTELRTQALRETIRQQFVESLSQTLAISVSSFGFKYGPPSDADIVMDVRFLPNPHYVAELRPLTGLDEPVATYLMERDETVTFLERWFALLDTVVPGYVAEGKHHLAIALGCTGGAHRSVALAEATAAHLRTQGYRVAVSHRDIGLDRSAL